MYEAKVPGCAGYMHVPLLVNDEISWWDLSRRLVTMFTDILFIFWHYM